MSWFKKSSAAADSSIPRPRGAANCLGGLIFVRTGELSGMTEDQLKCYISVYGGKLTGSISGKTNYLLMGESPGEVKQKAAKDKYIPIISEQQFYDLVVSFSTKLLGSYNYEWVDYTNSVVPINNKEEPQFLDTRPVVKKEQQLQQRDHTPFTVKYGIKSITDVIANKTVVESLVDQIINFKYSNFGIFVHGPPGTGKSDAIRTICKDNNLELVLITSSVQRTQKELLKMLNSYIFSNNIFNQLQKNNKKQVIVLDEAETMDQGGLPFLNKYIQNLINIRQQFPPIIFVTSDPKNQKLKTIKSKCIEIQFKRTNKNLITKFLNKILECEGIDVPNPQQLEIISERCSGDLRRCLQELQMFTASNTFDVAELMRFQQLQLGNDLLETTNNIFSFRRFISNNKNAFQQIINDFYSDSLFVPASIMQNYQTFSEYQLDYLADVSDSLSQADLILNQMYSQGDWSASRACAVFSTCIAGLQGIQYNIKHKGFLFPQFPSLISINKAVRGVQNIVFEVASEQLYTLPQQLEYTEYTVKNINTILNCEDPSSEETYILQNLTKNINDEFYDEYQQVYPEIKSSVLKKYLKQNAGIDKLQQIVELKQQKQVKKQTDKKPVVIKKESSQSTYSDYE